MPSIATASEKRRPIAKVQAKKNCLFDCIPTVMGVSLERQGEGACKEKRRARTPRLRRHVREAGSCSPAHATSKRTIS